MKPEKLCLNEGGKMLFENKQIFVVDDDESVCRALKILLMTFGFEVKTFNSAKSFFGVVPNDEPGCLVLDIHMPGLDGWAAQKKVLDSGSNRPVIFISAEKQGSAAGRALNVGAVGFLQKPVDGQTLVDLINAVVEKKDSTDEIRK
jgi:FixJ family two-component response regulator